jgi:vancomycin resistance protein YoaR
MDTQPVPAAPPAETPRRTPGCVRWGARLAAVLATAAVTLVLLLVVSASLYQTAYNGRIYPGVSVSGLDLSGLTAADAARQLAAGISYLHGGRIVFTFQDRRWVATPQDLGLGLDLIESVNGAYNIGRNGDPLDNFTGQFQARFAGVGTAPVLQYDTGRALDFLQRIAAEVDRSALEARLELRDGNVVAIPGQTGIRTDLNTMLSLVAVPIGHLTEAVIPVVYSEQQPQVLDASAQAETARAFLSRDFSLSIAEPYPGDPGPWTLPASTLAEMLTFRPAGDGSGALIQLALDENKLADFLRPLAESLSRQMQNARYHFNEGNSEPLELFIPSIRGRELSLEKSIQSIQPVVAQGGHQGNLGFDFAEPAVGDHETAAGLKIAGLLPHGEQWTSFKGSPEARIHNINLAASKFDGVLVAPGETFSMGRQLGDVTFDTGYAEALIILGNRTLPGAGGGVCQVSTTFYRVVFMTGFPIVERHSHAYRVGWYENYDGPVPLGVGFDATVFFPEVDFKFQNDTPYWILMETDADRTAGRLTWRFYSTSDGRSVSYTTSRAVNEVDPPDPRWEPNAALKPNEVKQVDWAVKGANVYVTRTVTRDGQVIASEPFNTHYIPWAAMCQYNPDTPPADGAKCP